MKKKNKGFSLIELSIVLIIMGLLVAGVTGGASLIKSAQLRSVATESETYRSAYNTFFAQFSRVPGGTMALPNNTEADSVTTSWKQLKEEGIIDIDQIADDNKCVNSKFKGACWFINYQGTVKANAKVQDFVRLNTLSIGSNKLKAPYGGIFNEIEARNLEDKLDDGKADTGAVRVLKATAVNGAGVETFGEWASGSSRVSTPLLSIIMKLDF